jgi:hypothetical protein
MGPPLPEDDNVKLNIASVTGYFGDNISLGDPFLLQEYKHNLNLKFGTFIQFLINRRGDWLRYKKPGSMVSVLLWHFLKDAICVATLESWLHEPYSKWTRSCWEEFGENWTTNGMYVLLR